MIAKIKYIHLLTVLFLISLFGCGFPQIATYPDLNYNRDEFKKSLQILWEKYPENKVNYDEIEYYISSIKKDKLLYTDLMFKEYVDLLSDESLLKAEIEKRFFHTDNSANLIMKNSWILKSENENVWYEIALLYTKRNNPMECTLSISRIKYPDTGIQWENYETLDKNEKNMITRKFENDILVKLKTILENQK